MSGPKVVRITSREEMEFIKKSQISLFRAVYKSIEDYVQKNNLQAQDILTKLAERLAEYEQLDAQHYQRFQQEIPAQIELFKQEKLNLEKKVINAIFEKHKKIDALTYARNSLISNFKEKSLEIPHALTNTWPDEILEHNLPELEERITHAFTSLISQSKLNEELEEYGLSSELEQLSKRLNKDHHSQKLGEWKKINSIAFEDPSLKRLNLLLSELQILEINPEKKIDFLSRAKYITNDVSDSRQKLLVDSLTLDIATFIKRKKLQKNTLQEIKNLITQIELLDTTCSDSDFLKLQEASENMSQKELQAILDRGQELKNKLSREYIEKSRRDAVLKGMQSIGYKVEDNLSTAWVENGRLVVKKGTHSKYGIELASASNIERCQIRVVVDEKSKGVRSTEEDLAEELSWCEDFSVLRKELAEEGSVLEIEKMLDPGELDLKEVSFDTDEWSHQNNVAKSGASKKKRI